MQRVDNDYSVRVYLGSANVVGIDQCGHDVGQVDSLNFGCQFVKHRLIVVQGDNAAVIDVFGDGDRKAIDVPTQDSDVLRTMDWQQGDDRVRIDLIVERVPACGRSCGQCSSLESIPDVSFIANDVSLLFSDGTDGFSQVQRAGVDSHARDRTSGANIAQPDHVFNCRDSARHHNWIFYFPHDLTHSVEIRM